MKFRVCICCGEPMRDTQPAAHKDPNVCASCSSFLDLADWFKETRESVLGVTGKVAQLVPEPTSR